MKEELFVMTDSGYERLDLNVPSGIQLNYKSNLFGDLSKIECSHTYTFKLPMTINNRRVLDFAEDIRHQSNMIRKHLTASYLQNGVNLFQNANLYVESIGTSYNAVMTWDVIGGMNSIKDNDISLCELPNNNEETYFGAVEATTEDESFSNTELVLHPIYNCGIPYYKWFMPYYDTGRGRLPSRYTSFGAYPMPVVPVYKILQMINSHFGTKFNLGNSIGIGGAKNYDTKRAIVEKGVLPLVGKDLNYEERYKRRCYLSGMNFTNVDTNISEENDLHIDDVITFTQIVCGEPTDYLETGKFRVAKHDESGRIYDKAGVQPKVNDMSLEIDGCVQIAFNDYPAGSSLDELPVLSLYQRQQKWKSEWKGDHSSRRSYYEWVELDRVEGENIGTSNNYRVFEFNFSMGNGGNRLSCANVKVTNDSTMRGDSTLIFVFNHRIINIISMQKDIEVFLKDIDKCIVPHNIDVISNLPDIGCLAFVKSLFYMMGAFPYVNANQEIIPRFYSELRDNFNLGNVLDWSSKLPGAPSDMPSEIKFATSDFAQSNYYLMKSDDLEPEYDPENVDDDVYASGVGCLSVENSTLERSKTVIQIPFFAPYTLNRKWPSYDTGNTIKCWTISDESDSEGNNSVYNRLEYCKPNPALGIITDKDFSQGLNTGETVVKGQAMSMEVWNGFGSIDTNDSYSYFQEIIRKPFIIKEDLLLNEFDLLDLDYTRPVYLDKYNSYFAVVSILRNGTGKCKCELIKLP